MYLYTFFKYWPESHIIYFGELQYLFAIKSLTYNIIYIIIKDTIILLPIACYNYNDLV